MTAVPTDLTQALLRPVRGHHAFEACVEQLAAAIRLGVYPPGSSLPSERELAERMAVSRATLREAMAALREAGIVTTRRGRGGGTVVSLTPAKRTKRSTVTPEQRADWFDALEFRRVVEPGGCWISASTPPTGVRRAHLVQSFEAIAKARGRAQARQADARYHLTIATLTDSPRMIEAITTTQAALDDMLAAIPVLAPNIAHSEKQHAVILNAILTGDAPRARRVMEEHCDDTAALLRGLLS